MKNVKDEVCKALREVRKMLNWEVTVIRQGSHGNPTAYAMQSFAAVRRHKIILPPNGKGLPYDRLSELHEYVHALLAETVHPIFGTSVIGTVGNLAQIRPVKGIINEAEDWFVNCWICQRYPVAFSQQFARNAKTLNPDNAEAALTNDPEPLWGRATLAEMAAELKTFTPWNETIFDPMVYAMACEFLTTNVLHPTADVAVDLVNRLIPAEMGLIVSAETRNDGESFWFVNRQPDLLAATSEHSRGHE